MDIPAGYELRATRPADLDAVADVFIADDLEEAGRVVLDADFVRDEWSLAGFDLATDAWVVTDVGGTIVGYGQVMEEDPNLIDSWGVVHPGHRGRGPPRPPGAWHRVRASEPDRGAGLRAVGRAAGRSVPPLDQCW